MEIAAYKSQPRSPNRICRSQPRKGVHYLVVKIFFSPLRKCNFRPFFNLHYLFFFGEKARARTSQSIICYYHTDDLENVINTFLMRCITTLHYSYNFRLELRYLPQRFIKEKLVVFRIWRQFFSISRDSFFSDTMFQIFPTQEHRTVAAATSLFQQFVSFSKKLSFSIPQKFSFIKHHFYLQKWYVCLYKTNASLLVFFSWFNLCKRDFAIFRSK